MLCCIFNLFGFQKMDTFKTQLLVTVMAVVVNDGSSGLTRYGGILIPDKEYGPLEDNLVPKMGVRKGQNNNPAGIFWLCS